MRVIVADVPVRFVVERLVDVVFVPVAFVQTIPDTAIGFTNAKVVNVAFVPTRLVTNAFVVVELVVVPLVKTYPVPVRLTIEADDVTVTEPAVKAKSVEACAVRLLVKKLVDVVFVPVAFVHEKPVIEPVAAERPLRIETLEAFRYWAFAVPVTLSCDVVTPPKKVTGTDVVAPRAVTTANVSVEYMLKQFVPFARQTL